MPAPEAPTMLTTMPEYDSVFVAWQEADDSGDAITDYEYMVNMGAWTATGSARPEFRIPNLAPDTAYSIRVRAVNSVGDGVASTALAVRTLDRRRGTVGFGFERQDDVVALLISQWRDNDKMAALVRGLFDVIDRRLLQPTSALENMRSLDLAEGVWLDYIGERLGFPRPYVNTPNVQYFDLAPGSGVGFNQAPFRSRIVDTFNLTPVVDSAYRNILRVWAGNLLHDGTIPVMNAAVRRVFPAAYYTDGVDGTLTLTIATTLSVEKSVLTDLDGFPRPAGVALTVV